MSDIKKECVLKVVKHDIERTAYVLICGFVLLMPMLFNILAVLFSGIIYNVDTEPRIYVLGYAACMIFTILTSCASLSNAYLILFDSYGFDAIARFMFIITTIVHLTIIVLLFTHAFWILSIELLIVAIACYSGHVIDKCDSEKMGDGD